MSRIKHYKTVEQLADEVRSEILTRPSRAPAQRTLRAIELFLLEGKLPSELLDVRHDTNC
jgi:hypothetical protein